MPSVRVVTYNIAGGRHPRPLRQAMRAVAADIAVINETPKLPLVWRWQCARLASAWGLRRVAGGRDAGSNMICASDRVQVLTTFADRTRQPRFAPRRGIVAAQCRVGGVDFGIVGVHLSLFADRRADEASKAVAVADVLRGPVVVAGDLNELPDRPAWQVLRQAGFLDYGVDTDLTFSTTKPAKRIDAVLVRGAAVSWCGIPSLTPRLLQAASDHYPVEAVLDLSA